jgi:hypothetical protein
LLGNEKTASKNYAFFIPNDPNYTMKNWVLFSSNERLASALDWELTFQLTKESLYNWDNVWSVIDRWINYWKLIIHCPNFVPNVSTFDDAW